jgi:hypothetical protein
VTEQRTGGAEQKGWSRMDGRSVAQPPWIPSGILRLFARLAGSSIARNGTGAVHKAATTDLAPAEVSYTESASQTAFIERVLAELEETFQTGDRADSTERGHQRGSEVSA